MSRPAQAQIDLSALEYNFKLLEELSDQGQIVAVIKANAYGHGAAGIASAMEAYVPMFGVASIEEAMALRQVGIYKPVLLMEGCFTPEEVVAASVHNFALVCHNEQQLDYILTASVPAPVKVWLKYDTGMHRLGFDQAGAVSACERLKASDNVQDNIVLTTHLACADELKSSVSAEQIHRFDLLNQTLNLSASIANSAGLLGWPTARRHWNRPGIALYGVSPFSEPCELANELKPVMRLRSAVIAVRDVAEGEGVGYGHHWHAARPSKIATVAIGYGDGYPRSAKNGTPVWINGQLAPLVGRVSMDMISIDVTDIDAVAIGDEVELWGPSLDVNQVANWADTLGYELLTRMPARTPRVYLESE